MQALESMKIAGYQIGSLIHIGANDGQERYEYLAAGVDPCIYVEPIDAVFAALQCHIAGMPGHRAIQAVCSEIDGERVEFNVANNGGLSSSILGLGAHAEFHPSITYTSKQTMLTTTVDSVIASLRLDRGVDLMVIDTQGAELKVLKGARKLLRDIDGVFVEVSEAPLYEGGCTHEQITEYLRSFGLRLRWMQLNAHGHGDAFYCRGFGRDEQLPTYGGNVALGKAAKQSSTSVYSKLDDASGAVNGRKNGGYSFHTDHENSPWWQVDLGSKHHLSEIRIYNRLDAARDRARTLRVSVSEDGIEWQQLHDQSGRSFGGADGRPLRILCSGAIGRHIRLQLNELNSLHLDEVEIY